MPYDSVLDRLSQNVTQNPQKTAIGFILPGCKLQRSLTYQQVWDESGRIAAHLKSKGVNKGDR